MLPWRPRFRWPRTIGSRRKPHTDTRSTSFDPGVTEALFIDDLLIVALVALVVLAILPTFIFVIEILILILVVLVTVLMKVLFRQPWIVDAIADDGRSKAWKVDGYRASRRAVSEIAEQLSRGAANPIARDATLVR